MNKLEKLFHPWSIVEEALRLERTKSRCPSHGVVKAIKYWK
jgi:hypothetical protein